jgi:hypothetical protein
LPIPELPPIVITEDEGGFVQQYAARVLANRNRRVVIDGNCASACTLWLMASRVCVTPRARMLFHAAFYAENGQRNTFATDWMYARYPSGVQRLIDRRGGIYSGEVVISYSELRQVLPAC